MTTRIGKSAKRILSLYAKTAMVIFSVVMSFGCGSSKDGAMATVSTEGTINVKNETESQAEEVVTKDTGIEAYYLVPEVLLRELDKEEYQELYAQVLDLILEEYAFSEDMGSTSYTYIDIMDQNKSTTVIIDGKEYTYYLLENEAVSDWNYYVEWASRIYSDEYVEKHFSSLPYDNKPTMFKAFDGKLYRNGQDGGAAGSTGKPKAEELSIYGYNDYYVVAREMYYVADDSKATNIYIVKENLDKMYGFELLLDFKMHAVVEKK